MAFNSIENNIAAFVDRCVKSVLADLNVAITDEMPIQVELEIPKDKSHGDLSTNVAMRISRFASKPPLELAGLLVEKIRSTLHEFPIKDSIGNVEAKQPGFINFSISKTYLHKTLLDVQRQKTNFGRTSIGRGVKLQVEFVSANPTGPLTIAHGRQAAIGDSLANILEFLGYDVTREYYLNDEGTQMNILGHSVRARYLQLCGISEEFPENGYKGTYVKDIAEDFRKKYGERYKKTTDIKYFREFGLRWILRDIKKDLKEFGVSFDVWFSQRGLRRSGRIDKALHILKNKGFIYENEGATWFKSQPLGDDKDRVLIKSDGSYTYLAPDIAYHLDKYRRNFKRIVDIWGPDHHGYIPRMKAAVKALGFSESSLSVLIVQLATLYKEGKQVSMSTRAGEFVTLREVMDEVGKDVARFAFIMRRISSHLDFDLDIVKKQSMENPVYYIQYAHARICSIIENSKSLKLKAKFNSALLVEPEEIEILRLLRQFSITLTLSGKHMEPYIILQYLQDLAGVFHTFYTKHRVISDNEALTGARLVLVDSVRIVLANGLRLLGVSFPKKM